MFYSIRSKLIASLLGVSLFVGAVSVFSGVYLLKKHVVGEASNRVRLDLNAASEMYRSRIKYIRLSLSITSLGAGFIASVAAQNTSELVYRLGRMARHAELDFAGIATINGRLLCRIGSSSTTGGPDFLENPISRLALQRQAAVEGTVLLTGGMLEREDPELAVRARIPLLNEGIGSRMLAENETGGMAMAAAVPVFEGNTVIAVLYGGNLLNRNEILVDTVRDTVFQGETYQGRNIGTATVFLHGTRIATNVLTPSGKRAIGTRVSPEIETAVLDNGQRWTGRDYGVSDWYIAAYEPIEDITGRRIGILYTPGLER